MAKKRSFVLEKQPSITLDGIVAHETFDRSLNEGVMFMRIADTHCEVSEDDGKKLGSISCPVGGGLLLKREGEETTYFASFESVWKAFERAMK